MIKQMIGAVALSFIALGATAQDHVLDLARADIRSGKMGMVAASLNLSAEQEKVFWPIYTEYADQQDALLEQRIELLTEFSTNHEAMTAEQAKLIAKRSFTIQRTRLERRETFFQRFAQALDPVLAARFIQVDSQISTLMDFELMKNTPLITAPVIEQ